MGAVSIFRHRNQRAAALKIIFLIFILPALAGAQGRPTSVLIFHQESGDSAGSNLFINGLRSELERESASPVFVYEEVMDRYEGTTDRSPAKPNDPHSEGHLNLL